MRALMIAGTQSGCGKTTVSLGLMAALKRKGLVVQPFKTGPDFIDAGLHRVVTGRVSRNLDIWMCGEEFVKRTFLRYASQADISIIEGVMGIFDGEDSTARLAQLLGVPVVLVLDAYGMAETAGAIVNGIVEKALREFRGIRFAGVIFNRVSGEGHLRRLKKGVEIPVLGYLPKEESITIKSRHLGLLVAEEDPLTEEMIERLSGYILEHVNIEEILSIFSLKPSTLSPQPSAFSLQPFSVAIARDRAFCFYYEDNLDILREQGFKIVEFSPLNDEELPSGIDALYIGGGYPEEYAEKLSKNLSMIASIKRASKGGLPIYAECGGLIYLSSGVERNGEFFPMVGVFPFRIGFKRRPVLGYREILIDGKRLRGHEFHYTSIDGEGHLATKQEIRRLFQVYNRNGEGPVEEGYTIGNTTVTYLHIHGGINPLAFTELFKER